MLIEPSGDLIKHLTQKKVLSSPFIFLDLSKILIICWILYKLLPFEFFHLYKVATTSGRLIIDWQSCKKATLKNTSQADTNYGLILSQLNKIKI